MTSITVCEPNGSRTIYTERQVAEILEACRTELAINFNIPSSRIIGVYVAKLGMTGDAVRQLLLDSNA